ncbi:MAG: hypothetical protein KAI93_11865, partial [Desulfobacterales bacterium]|nr:hypothetical protein [Desulfobacterales bacterium]
MKIKSLFIVKHFVNFSRDLSPATRGQRPVASSQTPAARVRRKLHWIPLTVLGCLLWISAAAAQITEQSLPDTFKDVIGKLSSLADRS